MEETETQTITLHSYPFRDKSLIVKLFSEKFGLISILVSHSKNKKLDLIHFTNPFCVSEVVLYKKKNFFCLKELTIIDIQMPLREVYFSFMTASKIVIAILESQSYEKPTPLLYALLSSYLKKIPEFEESPSLLISFYLKLLLHEGILKIDNTCNYCLEKASFLSDGESVCNIHQTNQSFSFTEKDFELLHFLCYAKKFSSIKEIEVSQGLINQMEKTFKSLIQK